MFKTVRFEHNILLYHMLLSVLVVTLARDTFKGMQFL